MLSVILAIGGSPERYANFCHVFRALREQTLTDYEIVVVENDKDQRLRDLRCSNVQYIHVDDEPFSKAWLCNVGARVATGEILLFIDGDALIGRNYLATVLDRFNTNEKWAFAHETAIYLSETGTYIMLCSQQAVQTVPLAANIEKLRHPKPEGSAGLAIVFEKNFYWDEVGGYNEYFHSWGGEDNCLARRAEMKHPRGPDIPYTVYHLHHEGRKPSPMRKFGLLPERYLDEISARVVASRTGKLDARTPISYDGIAREDWLLRPIYQNPFFMQRDDRGVTPFLLKDGKYEPLVTEYLQRHIRRGMRVIDGGAHIGYFTTMLSRRVHQEGHVFAYEPHEDNRNLLSLNVEVTDIAPKMSNTSIHAHALGDIDGNGKLYTCETNTGDHRMYEVTGRPSLEVPVRKLDNCFKPGDRLDFMKLDIQGAEFAAMRGAERILYENVDMFVIAEFWPDGIRAYGDDPQEMLDYMKDLRFMIYCLDDKADKPWKVTPEEAFEQAAKCELRDKYTNLLFTRKD